MKTIDISKLWIITYSHRHGVDAWPVLSTKMPCAETIASELDDFEPDRGEYVDVVGVNCGDIRDYDA